jgi:hypothetical protein
MTFNLSDDTNPALTGPPTQTIGGVTNKTPVVDNPNIKLPSQNIKGLDPITSRQTTTQSQKSVVILTSDSEESPTTVVGIDGTVIDKLNPKGIKPDGLGKDWSPDKFSPESIAGNDKFVNPKTGMVESTSQLVNNIGEKRGVVGGGQENYKTGKNIENIEITSAKLAGVQKDMTRPVILKPNNTPRIKTVEISRRNNAKNVESLLN